MSELLKAARAIEDDKFIWRVRAGAFYYAAQNLMTWASTTKEFRFATAVLLNPTSLDPSMLAFVATDPTNAGKIVLDGVVPNTDGVTDADIMRVIAARWSLVANKYPEANPGGGLGNGAGL